MTLFTEEDPYLVESMQSDSKKIESLSFLVMMKKLLFYSILGCLAALLVDFSLVIRHILVVFAICTFLYFWIGVLMASRWDLKWYVSTILTFLPLVVLGIYSFWFDVDSIMGFVLCISFAACATGYFISRCWSDPSILTKLLLLCSLICLSYIITVMYYIAVY